MNSHCKPETTRPHPTFVGIDVSKNHLDSFSKDSKPKRYTNEANGIRQLIADLRTIQNPRVICEATGGYEFSAAYELMAAGIDVCIVQASRVRHFAKALGQEAKTDKLDAKLLAQFGQKMDPRCSEPLEPSAMELRQICEARRYLLEECVELDGRLELAQGYLRSQLLAIKEELKKRLEQVDEDLDRHIQQDSELRRKSRRLQEVQGCGRILAATMLAYVPELGKIGDKQLSAIVGVAPYSKDSGNHEGNRSIRGGRPKVRQVLYMAALTAARCNPILSGLAKRLQSKGKPKKVALVAVMRKLLTVLNRLIADPQFSLA